MDFMGSEVCAESVLAGHVGARGAYANRHRQPSVLVEFALR